MNRKRVTIKAIYKEAIDRTPCFVWADGSYLDIKKHIIDSFKLKNNDTVWIIIVKGEK